MAGFGDPSGLCDAAGEMLVLWTGLPSGHGASRSMPALALRPLVLLHPLSLAGQLPLSLTAPSLSTLWRDRRNGSSLLLAELGDPLPLLVRDVA
jgi:hypothetical protein